MMNVTRKIVTASATAALVCIIAAAAPLPPVKPDAWSEAVSQLSGRLRIVEPKITADQYFHLTLELANRGTTPLAVQCGNPHVFTVTLLDGAGKQVGPTLVRADVLSSPQWGVIPRGSYLGLPVSIRSEDGAKGSHLDITTLIWKLSPGKYRVCATFSSGRAADFMGSPGKAEIWEGKIEIPPVDVEVIETK